MTHDLPCVLPLADARDNALCGGKATNLGRLLRAEFPVPDGFSITTAAFRLWDGGSVPEAVADAIRQAYAGLGSPTVAVRSSATAEDMADASMAGQYETFLNVTGPEDLLNAVLSCWRSLRTDRTLAYLTAQGIDPSSVAMAVVVQTQVAAEKAGVLFTANPRTGDETQMLVEASWGLGEAVVSGEVQPDMWILDAADGGVCEVRVGTKLRRVDPATRGYVDTTEDEQRRPCMDGVDIESLWHLGCAVARHFGCPQDLEWAMLDGRVFLLQSRAITTLGDAPERLRRELRDRLTADARRGRGSWVRHNLSETAPHPTPLTWCVLQRFMSGNGGFGSLYRTVGFEPGPRVAGDGMLELLGGRIYADLSRTGDYFFADYPFVYDEELLKHQPALAQSPPSVPTGTPRELREVARRLRAVDATLQGLAANAACDYRDRVLPEFLAWLGQCPDPTQLGPEELATLWDEVESRLMDDFAPAMFLPSLLAAHEMNALRNLLARHVDASELDEVVARLSVSPTADATFRASEMLLAVADGRVNQAEWLREFGHRATAEFDLASPRWEEAPEAFQRHVDAMRGARQLVDRHQAAVLAGRECTDSISRRLPGRASRRFRALVARVHELIPFREDAKNDLMRGYALLRKIAVAAGHHLGVDDGVFFLTRDEMRRALLHGFPPRERIRRRRSRYRAEENLSLPGFIDRRDPLAAPVAVAPSHASTGFAISPGVASGPARIVKDPSQSVPGDGFVLVCPSTDPSWTPLFARASAMVLECGGMLSHGAVVAREMGLPAVVLDGATTMFDEGEHIRVDGDNGRVLREGIVPEQAAEVADDIPFPPPSPKERKGWMVAGVMTVLWAVYFVLAFGVAPLALQQPANQLMDGLLMPVFGTLGPVVVVLIVSIGIAILTLGLQRVVTDNTLLLGLKKSAALARKALAGSELDDSERRRLTSGVSGAQRRILFASLVPLGICLGPMVMSLNWLAFRVPPEVWNAPPGSIVLVSAEVAGDFSQPITLEVAKPLEVTPSTPATQTVPPIRETLTRQRTEWNRPTDLSSLPWDAQAAAVRARRDLLASLDAYLAKPIPPQPLAWVVHSDASTPGRFAIRLVSDGKTLASTFAVLGNGYAPEWKEDMMDGKGPTQILKGSPDDPVRSLRVAYRQELVKGGKPFWRPFAALGWNWDPGWLLTYLLFYLPIFVGTKKLLRLP